MNLHLNANTILTFFDPMAVNPRRYIKLLASVKGRKKIYYGWGITGLMNVNKLSGTRIGHLNTRKIKRIYQLEGRKHSESFFGDKHRKNREKGNRKNDMVASWWLLKAPKDSIWVCLCSGKSTGGRGSLWTETRNGLQRYTATDHQHVWDENQMA